MARLHNKIPLISAIAAVIISHIVIWKSVILPMGIGGAVVNTESIPGMMVTWIAIILSIFNMHSRHTKIGLWKLTAWFLIIVSSVFTVTPRYVENGWRLTPLDCAFVAITLAFLAMAAEAVAIFWKSTASTINAVLNHCEWPEILFVVTVSNVVGDVFGAMHFSSEKYIATIGGMGWLDGLVWVPALLAGMYGVLRRQANLTQSQTNSNNH